MDMDTFLTLARSFADLGWSVQDQLVELDGGTPAENLNPNALKMIEHFLIEAEQNGITGTDILLDAIREAKEE